MENPNSNYNYTAPGGEKQDPGTNSSNRPSGDTYASVPLELTERRQWVCYKRVPKVGHPGTFDKVPYNARTGEKASTTDPATWSTFAQAVAGVTKWKNDGIGYVLADDDAGADFDHCRNKETGELAAWAVELLAPLVGGYIEVSPSDEGIHVLARGQVPHTGHKTAYQDGAVEMYSHGRFFTVTGNALGRAADSLPDLTAALKTVHDKVWGNRYNEHAGPSPDTNGKYTPPSYGATGLPDDDVLERCRTDKTGEQFTAFYDHADLFDVDHDDSRADWYVWNKLVFYLGDDVERIVRLAELGAHYRHPESEVKARERKDKWQRVEAAYGTLQRATIAQILASRTRDQIFYGGASLNASMPLAALVDATLTELATANDPARGTPTLYVRGGALVRVHHDEHTRPSIQPITEQGLKVEIDRVVRYTKRNTQGRLGRCHPPQAAVQGVLAAPIFPFPPLAGITEVPVMRPDGTVLATPGYDAATGLLYQPVDGVAKVPLVPASPTDEQVRAAYRLLHEVFYDFPFQSPADRANALGLLITLVMRPALPGNIPLALVDAPAPGTGKGLLVEALATIAVGHVVGALTEVESDAEWRKQITTELLTGRTFHLIDNVEQTLRSSGLASLLTTPAWADRLLATNKSVSIAGSARGVWCVTGNNLTIAGDLPRRCYRIRLDAKEANPYLRAPDRFKHFPLLEWVAQQRADILHALLTVCRAWFARGKPTKGAPSFGSFEQWVQVVWGILSLDPTRIVPASAEDTRCYGGCFLGNGMEVWEEGDSDAEEMEPFIRQLFVTFRTHEFTVAQLSAKVRSGRDAYGDRSDAEDTDLKNALPSDLLAIVNTDGFAKKLGWLLKRHVGTRYGSEQWRIERARSDEHTKTARWYVQTGA